MSDHRQGSCNRCGDLTKYIINSTEDNISIKFFTCRNPICISDATKAVALMNKTDQRFLRMEHT